MNISHLRSQSFTPTDDFIEEAVKLLINSKKPIIWSGQGVLYSSATKELEELAKFIIFTCSNNHARKKVHLMKEILYL
ncbi:MAG: hypothetical protein ACJ0HA_03550 [Dehalococcoidia bacterium]